MYSQRGNISFPVWECDVPNVGIIVSLIGDYDTPLMKTTRHYLLSFE